MYSLTTILIIALSDPALKTTLCKVTTLMALSPTTSVLASAAGYV
jgi:hypothetical protein